MKWPPQRTRMDQLYTDLQWSRPQTLPAQPPATGTGQHNSVCEHMHMHTHMGAVACAAIPSTRSVGGAGGGGVTLARWMAAVTASVFSCPHIRESSSSYYYYQAEVNGIFLFFFFLFFFSYVFPSVF